LLLSYFDRFRDLVKIKSFEDSHNVQPFIALDEKSEKDYTHTLTHLMLYLVRRSNGYDQFPSLDVAAADSIKQFSDNPTVETLQAVLMKIFSIWDQSRARDEHTLGQFLRFSSIRKEGGYATIHQIHQSIVKLVYLVRLGTFKELLTQSAPEKSKILELVKYPSVLSFLLLFLLSFPFLSFPFLSFPFLSFPFLSFPSFLFFSFLFFSFLFFSFLSSTFWIDQSKLRTKSVLSFLFFLSLFWKLALF